MFHGILIRLPLHLPGHLRSAMRPVELLKKVHKRRIQILAFANNHYAGFRPATVELFKKLWTT